MPLSGSGAAQRARYQLEVSGWLTAGVFNGDVNALSKNHWRAAKEMRATLHIRPPRQETPVDEAARAYPCWLQLGDRWVPMGNIRHLVAGDLIQESHRHAHNNPLFGFRVRVQSDSWQTPHERELAEAQAATWAAQMMAIPVPTPPTLTGARRQALNVLLARPSDHRMGDTGSWLFAFLSNGGGAILGTRVGSNATDLLYDTYIDIHGEGRIQFTGQTTASELRNISAAYPRIPIWLRSEPNEEYVRMARDTPLIGRQELDGELSSWDTAGGISWSPTGIAAPPPRVLTSEEAELARRQANERTQRRAENARYGDLYDRMPRSRRSACRELYNDLSRATLERLQVSRVDSTDDLTARDYVRLSEELARMALAGEADDDVLKDNENDYPTESE
jgi:hypothetical protein